MNLAHLTDLFLVQPLTAVTERNVKISGQLFRFGYCVKIVTDVLHLLVRQQNFWSFWVKGLAFICFPKCHLSHF